GLWVGGDAGGRAHVRREFAARHASSARAAGPRRRSGGRPSRGRRAAGAAKSGRRGRATTGGYAVGCADRLPCRGGGSEGNERRAERPALRERVPEGAQAMT